MATASLAYLLTYPPQPLTNFTSLQLLFCPQSHYREVTNFVHGDVALSGVLKTALYHPYGKELLYI